MNMNEKPKLERKKTPLRQLNAEKTTIPRDDQPTTFDPSKPITEPAAQGRTIEITEVEYRYPKAGNEKYGEGMPEGNLSPKPLTKDAEWTESEQNKPGIWEGAKDKVLQGKDMVLQGIEKTKEKAKETFTSDKPTTTTITPDSELTENKPGVLERVKGVFTGPTTTDSEYVDQNKPGVLQGAKNMVWQGVEKAKGVFASTKWTEPTELHPGNGYDWKRVVGDQGEVRWVATNDWSGDSANRGGIIEGAKGIVRSGVERAKGVFVSRPDAKESEYTDYTTQDQSKPGVLQGAKEKVLQGVEKAKSVFYSSAPTEEHPGRSYTWHKTTGPEGQTHWVARDDWSHDSANQQPRTGVLQGAKEKVMQGVEKAKGVFSSATTTTTPVEEDSRPGVLQGAKDKVMQGVEKAKEVFSSATTTTTPAEEDWSQSRPGVLQGAKEKVMQGVEKAKGVFSTKPEATTITPVTEVPMVEMQQPTPVQGVGYQKVEIEKEFTPSGYGRQKMTVEKSADPQFNNQTGFKEQTGTYSS